MNLNLLYHGGEIMYQVDREKNIPLYIQLVEYWRARIKQNSLKPGDQLPTEKELMDLHNVSRITVKQAVRTLVNEGLVETVQGKGTFVRSKKHQWELSKLYSFSEDMRSRGFTPRARVLKKEICKGPVEQLGLTDNNALTIKVERLRLADEEPMAIEVLQVDYYQFSNIYDEIIDDVSVYELMENKSGVKLAYATEYLEASLPNGYEQKLLKITGDTPVLKMERITCAKDNKPIEYTVSVYRGDKYRFKVTLER